MTSIVSWFRWPKGDGGGESPQPQTPPPEIPGNPPPSGPRPDGGRRPVSEKPKPGSPDDVGACLEALQAAEAALAAERAAQAKRVAALTQCRQSDGDAPVRDFADLQRSVEEAKKQFEELQAALKDEVAKQLAALDKFNSDYDKLWAEAVRGTEDYMNHYPEMMVDLQKIWDEYGNREWARQVAEWVDTAIQAAMAGLDAYHLGAGVVKGLAAESVEAAQIAGRAAAREEAAAARAAGTMEREAAGVGEREAAQLARERQLAEAAEQEARAARAESEAAERAAREQADREAAQLAHERELNEAIEREAKAARAEREAAEEAAKKAEQDAFQPQDPVERQQAIENSGMVPDHGERFSGVAAERDEVIMVQGTNKTATPHIADGAATKNMHIKGKSADSGPAEGFIPVDQSLSRKVADPSEALLAQHGSKEKVAEYFNGQVQKCIDEGYATETTVIGKDGNPVRVLADPVTKKPITADYDLLAVGTKKPEMLQVPDPDLGNITAGGRRLKDDINHSVVSGNRSVENPVVHHGPANEAPVNPGINYPVTAYEPNGNVISIPKGPAGSEDQFLKQYFNNMNQRGYHMQPHPEWGWSRGADYTWQ